VYKLKISSNGLSNSQTYTHTQTFYFY